MMMRTAFIIGILQVFYFQSAAQQDQSFRINSVKGDTGRFYRSVYRYPQFINGYIFFKNQKVASALLNYNRLSGQILFVSTKGDTLEPANPGDIQLVALAQDTFYYYDKTYVELISHYKEGINLFKKETIQYNGTEKKGAYGGYSNTTAANSIDKVSDENDMKKIGVDENVLYVSSSHYYLAGPDHHFLPAGKKNFKKLFPKKEEKLNDYLLKNKLTYNDEKELLALLDYLHN